MRRSMIAAVVVLLVVSLATSSRAQTPAERCLSMRLALLGATMSTRLHCHAWAVGTRTSPAEACLAYGDAVLAERLPAAGCASEEEIATLIDLAQAGTAALVDAQTVASRVSEFESGVWNTEAIVDFARTYDPAMAWPDTSCRSTGHCPDLHILRCETTERPDGTLDTTCTAAPESRFQGSHFPVFVTENTALPTGEILVRVTDGGAPFEIVVTLSADGMSYTGRGRIDALPIFIVGSRVR